jgi:hypothetical protein
VLARKRFTTYQNEEMRCLTKSLNWSNCQAQEEQCQRIGLLQGFCLRKTHTHTKEKKQKQKQKQKRNIEITKRA